MSTPRRCLGGCLVATTFSFFFCIAAAAVAEYIAPEALHNVAHVKFPLNSLALQNHKTLEDRYGVADGYRCSSFIGPQCVTTAALAEGRALPAFKDAADDIPNIDLSLKLILKPAKPGQTLEELISEMASTETEAYALHQESAALAAGKGKDEAAKAAEEAREMMRRDLAADLSDEDIENIRSALRKRGLEMLAQATEQVAEALGYEDMDTIREMVMTRVLLDLINYFEDENEEGDKDGPKADSDTNSDGDSNDLHHNGQQNLMDTIKDVLQPDSSWDDNDEDEYEDVELDDES